MRKLLFILIVLSIILFSDFFIGAFSKKLILKVPDIGVNQTNSVQSLFHRKSDVLILGPSTANHHYDTKILKDSLNLTVYNAGYDGQNMLYCAMVFYSYLKRCTPKIIFIDLTPSVMNSDWNSHIAEMNCFYGISDDLDAIINDISPNIKKIKLRSNIYRYNNSWQWLIHSYINNEKNNLDGYRPMPIKENIEMRPNYIPEISFSVDRVNLKYLNNIVKVCKQKNIKLFISISPSLVIANKNRFNIWVNGYCKQKSIPLIDKTNDNEFIKHAELFYDYGHLNSNGAKIFTNKIISSIKKNKDSNLSL